MKKILFYLMLALSVATTASMMTACGDDKDKEEPKPQPTLVTKNLVVSFSSNHSADAVFTKTLNKDTLDKIFSDSNVGTLKIEFMNATNLGTVSTNAIKMAVDSLHQAVNNSVYGSKIKIESTVWFVNSTVFNSLPEETKQKLQAMGIELFDMSLALNNSVAVRRKSVLLS
ncbi:MAG: hypothetical protein LBN27_01570 [Prevotellaceae bacterium]|jgi:TRAP-type C4-dicarboxylate transport system substrate-binding protein|nr:hypothetical protein [Prevotellaceae bacterium]